MRRLWNAVGGNGKAVGGFEGKWEGSGRQWETVGRKREGNGRQWEATGGSEKTVGGNGKQWEAVTGSGRQWEGLAGSGNTGARPWEGVGGSGKAMEGGGRQGKRQGEARRDRGRQWEAVRKAVGGSSWWPSRSPGPQPQPPSSLAAPSSLSLAQPDARCWCRPPGCPPFPRGSHRLTASPQDHDGHQQQEQAGCQQRCGDAPSPGPAPCKRGAPAGITPWSPCHHPAPGHPRGSGCCRVPTWAGRCCHRPHRHVLVGTVILIGDGGCGARGKLQVGIDHALGHAPGGPDGPADSAHLERKNAAGFCRSRSVLRCGRRQSTTTAPAPCHWPGATILSSSTPQNCSVSPGMALGRCSSGLEHLAQL